jgi:hypothetical protein
VPTRFLHTGFDLGVNHHPKFNKHIFKAQQPPDWRAQQPVNYRWPGAEAIVRPDASPSGRCGDLLALCY